VVHPEFLPEDAKGPEIDVQRHLPNAKFRRKKQVLPGKGGSGTCKQFVVASEFNSD
jgi:hypothetical protein